MMKKLSENIKVELIDDDELVKRVLEEKRKRFENEDRYDGFYSPDEETLNRWIVNYIRHRLTSYDYSLQELYGKVGQTEGYKAFKQAILEKISKTYPKYMKECKNQSEM